MKISFSNNVVTINTGIKMDAICSSGATLKDEKGNTIYAICRKSGNAAALGVNFIEVNSVDDEGNACLTQVVPLDFDKECFIKCAGDMLIAAATYLPQLAADMESKARVLEDLFE